MGLRNHKDSGVGAIKDNGKGNKAAKKKAKKIKKPKLNRVSNPRKVLKDITALVEANADQLAAAVIEEGFSGQVSPVKFLFEIAHIFPPADASTPTEREESLAETLLDALKIPKSPVVHDELQKEEDEDVEVAQPARETEMVESAETEDREKAEIVGVS